MITLETAELLDKVLLKFEGDQIWTWQAINLGTWSDIDPSPHVLVNEVKHLLGLNILTRLPGSDSVCMTDKGASLFADRVNNGFVATYFRELREKEEKERMGKKNRRIQWAILIISAIGLFALLFNLHFR